MTKPINAVIFDWAGTTVDFGCFAPLYVFVEIFKKRGIEITLEEARGPMGMLKKDHVRALLQIERISRLWAETQGGPWTEEDVEALYADFEPALMKTLKNYTTPLPKVLEVCRFLRDEGIKIGSTTGYTSGMMAVVRAEAEKQGYQADCFVTAEETGGMGRPYPYMIYRNMEKLSAYPPETVIKVGDTISDIQEGRNAGVISVGVVIGSSVMGLTQEEYENLDESAREREIERVRAAFNAAGADYVIDDMGGLPELIKRLSGK